MLKPELKLQNLSFFRKHFLPSIVIKLITHFGNSGIADSILLPTIELPIINPCKYQNEQQGKDENSKESSYTP